MRFPVPCPQCNVSEAEARWVTNDFRCHECNCVFSPDKSPFRSGSLQDMIYEELLVGGTLFEITFRVLQRYPDAIQLTVYNSIAPAVKKLKGWNYTIIGLGTESRKVIPGKCAQELILGVKRRDKWKSRDRRSLR